MNFIALLMGNKQLIFVAILAIIIAGQTVYIKMLVSEKTALFAEKTTLSTQLNESQAISVNLRGDITTQNAAIDNLKLVSDKRVADNLIEVRKATQLAMKYKAQAELILITPAPAGVAKCTAAYDIINKELLNGF